VADPQLRKILALLESAAHERQIAAAIVLGELGTRDAAVIDALASAVARGIPPVQRHALDALGHLAAGAGVRRAMPAVLAGLAARDEAVRRAAVDAAIAIGEEAIGPVRTRLATATDPLERRALEEVLGRVGGKDAFKALLAALDTPDVEAARAAALAVRQRMKEASTREKAASLAEVTKLLKVRAAASRKGASLGLVSGGLKILGYLEEPAAVPTLLAFARDAKQPPAVREEAIVALRFTARGKATPVATALAELAERATPELARAALYSLASLELPPAIASRLQKIALGREPERALLAIERLAQIAGAAGANGLAAVLSSTSDRGRAEAAAAALGARADGALALGRALASTESHHDHDHDGRIALLARLLRPQARALLDKGAGAAGKKLARALVSTAVARVGRGGANGDALLPLARELDRASTAAGLRAEAAKQRKRKNADGALSILRLIGQSTDATADDGYALASAELAAGRRDEALVIFGQLLERGFDLAAAVRKDRELEPDERYQIGFALIERRNAAGEEILSDLASSGRSKVAAMAKAKLKSAGYS
jgi:HEAT repeat protein